MRAFVILAIVFGFGYATFISLFTVLGSLTGSPVVATSTALVMIGSGVVGSILISIAVAFRPWYRLYVICGATGGLFGMAGIALSLHFEVEAALYASSAVAGTFFIGLMPIVFECAAEVAYPVSSSTATALLLVLGNSIGLLYVIGYSTLLMPLIDAVFVFSLFGVASISLLWFKPVLLRTQAND